MKGLSSDHYFYQERPHQGSHSQIKWDTFGFIAGFQSSHKANNMQFTGEKNG
ncbi:MAG: hypothetical protein ACFFCZ_02760 [Promethearchaeota archaeon]